MSKPGAILAVTLGIIIVAAASLFAMMALGRPGAEVEAIRFGEAVHKAIPNEDLLKWARSFENARPKDDPHELAIERSEWPPQIEELLKDNPYAKVFVHFDASQKPNGFVIRNTIEGVVVPMNDSLPELGYFSLHHVADDASYQAFSIYR